MWVYLYSFCNQVHRYSAPEEHDALCYTSTAMAVFLQLLLVCMNRLPSSFLCSFTMYHSCYGNSTCEAGASSCTFCTALIVDYNHRTHDRLRPSQRMYALSQAVDQEAGTDLDPSNAQAGGPRGSGGPPGAFRGPVSDHPPELGSIQRASIRSIKPYGVFVQMEGFRSNALVHLSQVPIARSAAWLSLVHVCVTC